MGIEFNGYAIEHAGLKVQLSTEFLSRVNSDQEYNQETLQEFDVPPESRLVRFIGWVAYGVTSGLPEVASQVLGCLDGDSAGPWLLFNPKGIVTPTSVNEWIDSAVDIPCRSGRLRLSVASIGDVGSLTTFEVNAMLYFEPLGPADVLAVRVVPDRFARFRRWAERLRRERKRSWSERVFGWAK